jgi:hypothetical protein
LGHEYASGWLVADGEQLPPVGPQAVTRASEQPLSQPKSWQLLSPGMRLLPEQLLGAVQFPLCRHSKVAVQVRPVGVPQLQDEQPGSSGGPVITGDVEKYFQPLGQGSGEPGLRSL